MSLLKGRQVYKPFVYPKAYDYWLKAQQVHWLHTEVAMGPDVQDWKTELSEVEKNVVGGILKGFTQTELIVNEYWTNKVSKWFKHPEVTMMATTFGAFETIHTVAYANLNDTLGIEDYEAFLYEPTAKAKIDNLLEASKGKEDKKKIATSLAVFSGFVEGVSLFSSFAVLLSFSRFNKLKGIGQIISWSIRDESLHSEAGCWLFREFVKENPEIWTDDFKRTLYEAARTTVKLEDDFIDKVFETGEIEELDPKDLKAFIRNRANVKLGDLGLKTNWKNVDKESLERMSWFDFLSSGTEHQDFFSQRPTDYAKGNIDYDDLF